MKRLYITFLMFCFLSTNSFANEGANGGVDTKKNEKTVIKSNEINKESNDVIKAIGDVEIKKGDRIFNASEVEYNQTTKVIKSNSNVKVLDQKQDNIFFSESADITDDFNIANFYNGVMIFRNGSNISSPHIKKINENELIIDTGRYSVCPTNMYDTTLTYEEAMESLKSEKTPLFSLKSSQINANTEKKQLSLWGTSVWVWKIPIFYIPYLKTGLAFHETLNGFDIPGIENTSHYGYGLYMPYKITTNTQKIVITPKIYQKKNYMANIKYNFHPNHEKPKNIGKWNINFTGDVTNDNGASKNLTNAYNITEWNSGKYKKWRSYAASNGFYNFNDFWSFDYNAAIVGDRYYLRDYYQNGVSYIESNFRFTDIDMNTKDNFNYFQFDNLFYQELLEDNTAYNLPRYAPVTNFQLQNTIAKNDANNLFYRLKLNTTNLFKKVGVEYNRITLTPSINDSLATKFGVINTDFELRGDVYALNEVGTRVKTYDTMESRLLPQLNIEWRKAFTFKNILFQPIIKYSGSPNSENFERKIPNEDSEPQGVTFENIFSNNRFIGYDRQEFGNRITYGFESTIYGNFGIGIAQGYRDNIKDNLQRLIGFEKSVSDYVGYASYVLSSYFDIYYRFLVDKDDLNFKRNEVSINFSNDDLAMYLTYINMDKNLLYSQRQKQINAGIIFTIYKRWKIDLSGIVDIEHNNRFLESRMALTYDGDCTRWEVGYRNYNPLTDTDKNTSLNFSFSVKFL